MENLWNDPQVLFKIAQSNLPLLLRGETGSGKEVLARKVHALSLRYRAPFVAVNCGALTPSLLESTLFGVRKGAFTGATRDSPGLVRSAQGGTLFLDEIGELPLDSQTRLLRVLQEKSVLPVGAEREVAVDFRLMVATHRNLELMVKQGLFREDLFHRIHVFPFHIPPLRERRGEIPLLAKEIWKSLGESWSYHMEENLDILLRYVWPGNVREMRSVLERYSVLQPLGYQLEELLHLPKESLQQSVREMRIPYRQSRPSAEEFLQAWQSTGANQCATARMLGVSRGCVQYWLKGQSQTQVVRAT